MAKDDHSFASQKASPKSKRSFKRSNTSDLATMKRIGGTLHVDKSHDFSVDVVEMRRHIRANRARVDAESVAALS